MKYYLTTIFLLLVSCTNLNRRTIASSEKFHIVFDIDWTLVSPVENLPSAENVIEVHGEKYRLHDHVREMLLKLNQRDDITISFFSGGDEVRNKELLKKIMLTRDTSAYDIAYKVLNKEDLTTIHGVSDTARFSERYKKDLKKIHHDISKVIMVEDNPFFAIDESQRKQFLYLGETYKFYESYKEATVARSKLLHTADSRYVPDSFEKWMINKNRIMLLSDTLNQEVNPAIALEKWKEFGFENNNLQWKKINKALSQLETNCEQLFGRVVFN